MPDWKKIGRNSKNKGRAYERRIAEELGWTRVPFSGASRDWGEGDVVDGYYSKKGFWRGECKKQPARKSGDIAIEQKWIEQVAAIKDKSRMNVYFTQTHGSHISFVFLPPNTLQYIVSMIGGIFTDGVRIGSVRQGSKGMGFKVFREEIDAFPDKIWFVNNEWVGMRLPVFKEFITKYNLSAGA